MRNHLYVLLVMAGLVLLDATVALARAGGGGGYSSGGSSSSSSYSSSSGSSSGGGGDFTLFDLIVVVALIAFAIYAKRKVIADHRAAAKRRMAESDELAASIRRRDPEFDGRAFTVRVSQAFHAIQKAWSEQDLEPVRGFMSDGLHERFSIQLREQRALGYRNQLSNLKIRECVFAEARALAHFDIVSLRITASALDIRIDTASGDEIEGSRRAESFTEIWSFLRGSDASKAAEQGLLEGQCPNCAAPVDPKRAWACESCGSDLDGAPPDWVLVEITQLSEWKPRDSDEPDWLKSAASRDPGLTEQQLEDRASVLFWRLMDAERTGRVHELASVARPTFLEAQRASLAASGERYLGDCAVGAVVLRGIIPGAVWDLALVEIRWSGGTYLRRRDGKPEDTGTKSLRRSLLVMSRRTHTKSSVGRCIVSAHCRTCGAPDEGTIDGACAFCGEPLNDGTDWLIDGFPYLTDSDAIALLAELNRPKSVDNAASDEQPRIASPAAPPQAGGMEIFSWCLKLAYADENFDRRERTSLEKLAERLGIPPTEARKLRQAAQFGRLEVEGPADSNQALIWARELRATAEADGRITRGERHVLDDLEGRAAR
jgi:hypothetical protein